MATASFYRRETAQRLAAEEQGMKQPPGMYTPKDNVPNGGMTADEPSCSLSLPACKSPRTSVPPLLSCNDCPSQHGCSCSAEVPNTSSAHSQSPSADLEHKTDPILALKERADVDVTPEFSFNFGGGGEGADEVREKAKEVRKLFPLFDVMTWSRQARQAGQTPKGNAPSRKRWVDCHRA